MTGFNVSTEYFKNYEVTKLYTNNLFFLKSSIYLTLFLNSFITLKKSPSTFLDFSQTEQIKGLEIKDLAMFFVIVWHFWQHVCNEHGSFLVFRDYSVTLFLLLFGYGLISLIMIRQVHARLFITKRVKKILFLYWLVTIGNIIADHILLQKHYHLHKLLLAFSSINVSKSLQYFDNVRCFITLLLINYLVFLVCAKLGNPPKEKWPRKFEQAVKWKICYQ